MNDQTTTLRRRSCCSAALLLLNIGQFAVLTVIVEIAHGTIYSTPPTSDGFSILPQKQQPVQYAHNGKGVLPQPRTQPFSPFGGCGDCASREGSHKEGTEYGQVHVPGFLVEFLPTGRSTDAIDEHVRQSGQMTGNHKG